MTLTGTFPASLTPSCVFVPDASSHKRVTTGTFISTTSVSCAIPSWPIVAAAVPVSVTYNAEANVAPSTASLQFAAEPRVFSISPSTGDMSASTLVTLTGTNFRAVVPGVALCRFTWSADPAEGGE